MIIIPVLFCSLASLAFPQGQPTSNTPSVKRRHQTRQKYRRTAVWMWKRFDFLPKHLVTLLPDGWRPSPWREAAAVCAFGWRPKQPGLCEDRAHVRSIDGDSWQNSIVSQNFVSLRCEVARLRLRTCVLRGVSLVFCSYKSAFCAVCFIFCSYKTKTLSLHGCTFAAKNVRFAQSLWYFAATNLHFAQSTLNFAARNLHFTHQLYFLSLQ